MQWLEITINTAPERIDGLCDSLERLGVQGLIIDDEAEYTAFLENNRQYWDYIDEELEQSIKGVSRVKFYLEDTPDGAAELARLRSLLPGETLTAASVRDEDWENNWKEFYKPLKVGERLLIVPQWEKTPETGGRSVLRLDPGLIFGTGAHATTQMCLRALEKVVGPGKTVLDLGCGSGILSIAALVLGADRATGCDIDPKAPDVALENAALSGIGPDRYSVFAGDVLSDATLARKLGAGKFDLVLANIVADVIIALAPRVKEWMKPDGVFICSGIIEGRQEQVAAELRAAGLDILESYTDDGWHCFKTCLEEN